VGEAHPTSKRWDCERQRRRTQRRGADYRRHRHPRRERRRRVRVQRLLARRDRGLLSGTDAGGHPHRHRLLLRPPRESDFEPPM